MMITIGNITNKNRRAFLCRWATNSTQAPSPDTRKTTFWASSRLCLCLRHGHVYLNFSFPLELTKIPAYSAA